MATIPTLPFTGSGGSVLPPYQAMVPGQYIRSPSGQFTLAMQADGNLVMYDNYASKAVWVADEKVPYSTTAIHRGTENTHVYIQYYMTLFDVPRRRRWTAIPDSDLSDDRTLGLRTFLQIQDDGNIVINRRDALWSSNSSIPLVMSGEVTILAPGTALVPGHFYTCGDVRLVFQGDGNLVLYGANNSVLWASYTQDKGANQAVLQADGNLVIYTPSGVALWNSGTGGQPGAFLQIQSSGSFVIVKEKPIWARFGYKPTIIARPVFYPKNTDPLTNSQGPYPTYGHIGYEF
jgi:hypothetical protein